MIAIKKNNEIALRYIVQYDYNPNIQDNMFNNIRFISIKKKFNSFDKYHILRSLCSYCVSNCHLPVYLSGVSTLSRHIPPYVSVIYPRKSYLVDPIKPNPFDSMVMELDQRLEFFWLRFGELGD